MCIRDRYIPVNYELKQQVTVPVETLKNDKITSCLASDGQHVPRTRKHCRPCAKHARDTEVRAHTCLHGFFSVEHPYRPGTSQGILLGVTLYFFESAQKSKKKSKILTPKYILEEEKIFIFDDQLLYHLIVLLRSIQKCDCSLLCINAHYLLSHINAKSYTAVSYTHLTLPTILRV